MAGEYERVLTTQELGPGAKREVEVGGEALVLVNVGQTYYALQANCPHDSTNLATEGRLLGDRMVCPYDDWAYDVRTGHRVDPPGGPRLRRYGIRVEGNEILVGPELPPDGGGQPAATARGG